MPRFAANLSTMFGEHDFLDRVDAAASCGFEALECQFPYATDAAALLARLEATGLELTLLNAPPGDFAAGDRGLAGIADRDDDFRASVETALVYAEAVGCPRIHVMAGCPNEDSAGAQARLVDRIGWAADRVAGAAIDVMLEPMSRRDVPGYLLSGSRQTEDIIAAIGRPNVRLQFDTYHLQVNEGDLLETFRRCQSIVGHVQFSSLPGRHEPDAGEVDHHWFFDQLDELGYGGWVGCEYRPRNGTLEGLGWAERYGIAPPTAG